jgi:hypothetical protein
MSEASFRERYRRKFEGNGRFFSRSCKEERIYDGIRDNLPLAGTPSELRGWPRGLLGRGSRHCAESQ